VHWLRNASPARDSQRVRLALIERCRGVRFSPKPRPLAPRPERPSQPSRAPAFWYGWRPWRPLLPWWLPFEDGIPLERPDRDRQHRIWHLVGEQRSRAAPRRDDSTREAAAHPRNVASTTAVQRVMHHDTQRATLPTQAPHARGGRRADTAWNPEQARSPPTHSDEFRGFRARIRQGPGRAEARRRLATV
jgi:hypothetical protein